MKKSKASSDKAAAPTTRRRVRGSTAVHEVLREDILSLKLEPGAALDEVALAERFGLSRTPVREALLMLAGEDLVKFLPNRSTIVMPHTMSNADEYMDTLLLLARALTRLAAECRSDDDLAGIERARDVYARALEGGAATGEIVAADLAFHRAVSSASRNQFMHNFFSLTLDYGRRMMLLHFYNHFDAEARRATVAEHGEIVDAIARRDLKAAEQAASRHIFSGLKVIQNSLAPKVGQGIALDEALVFHKGG